MPSELLTEVESKITDRLTELRPLHDEYLELSEFAERMGITAAASAATTAAVAAAASAAKPRAKKKAAPKPAKPAKRANGSNGSRAVPDRRADLIRMVNENPGITIREVGEKLGIDGTQFYRHRNNLVDEGVFEARGPNLFPKGSAAPAGAGEGGGEGDGAGA